jgi:hypothetical protein
VERPASTPVQERFIEQYYFADEGRKPAKGRRA